MLYMITYFVAKQLCFSLCHHKGLTWGPVTEDEDRKDLSEDKASEQMICYEGIQ